MKHIAALLTVFGLISASFTQAQAISGKVNGTVTSAQKPVDAASVGLLRAKDSGVVKLAVSDKTGAFELENLKQGKYLVSVQAAGHSKFYSEVFEISAANTNYTVKSIALKASSKELAGVTVTASKPMIEQKIDRTIVNVEASVSNTGTNALEVLEKSPGISVDKDGNISLKGKQGVQVFIDGRPTYLSGQDLANMLRNLQSSQLDQLEIMTNPPAKYDAAGNSGIINIKTKKNKQVGYNGSVTASYGQGVFPKTNESANMNYRNGSINLFGNISYSYRERFQQLTIQRSFADDVTKNVLSRFSQENNLRNKDYGLNGKIGMDYFASKKTTLGVVLTGNTSDQDFASRGIINIANAANSPVSQTRAFSDNSSFWNNFSTNINMRHAIDTTGSEITADIDYIKYGSGTTTQVTNGYYDPSGSMLAGSKPDTLLGKLPQSVNIYSAKVDYLKPLKKGARFEAGLKTSVVKTDNNASYDSLIYGNRVHDFGRSNHFVYEENINAAYVNISGPISKKFSGQLGLRFENTHATGNQLTTGTVFTRDYSQLFPTAFLQYQVNAKNTLVLNYGKRISRPDYSDLNPFVTFIDRYTYMQGNPNLKPQFSHNVELTHTYNNFLTTTLNYSKTTDIIQDVFEQNSAKNETFVKKSNIASRRQLGISVNAAFPITKWWSNNFYTNIYNNQFQGIVNNEYVNADATTAMFNVNEQFKFNKGWGAELSGFYRTPGLEGILKISGFGAMNVGVSKQLMKNKASLRLSVRDILWSQRMKATSQLNNVDAQFQQYSDSRVINIAFTYRFMKGKVGNTQRKRGGANEEAGRVKGGDN